MKIIKFYLILMLFFVIVLWKLASLKEIISSGYSTQVIFCSVSDGKFVLFATRLYKGVSHDQIQ